MRRSLKKALELIVKKEGIEKLFASIEVSEFELIKASYNILKEIPDYEFDQEEHEAEIFNDLSETYWENSSAAC